MGLPVEVNNLMLGSLGGYTVGRSLRFRSSASAYLNRTPASASNRKTWTWSGWVKRGDFGTNRPLLSAYSDANNRDVFQFDSAVLQYVNLSGGSVTANLQTTSVYRDPSAWYHIVLSVDTTQATSSNRIKLYVNGVQVTVFTTATYPSQNADMMMNNNVASYIGREVNGSQYFEGYLAEVNFIDGQALTPSSFGAYDTNGVWQPKKYTGTYGTNGFYLPFSNTTSTTTLVQDSSGNGNNWTPNNISLTAGTTYDSMIDSPTNAAGTSTGIGNYAVLNPLSPSVGSQLSNGNLTSSNGGLNVFSTIQLPTSGKWYAEFNPSAVWNTGAYLVYGAMAVANASGTYSGLLATTNASNGGIYQNGSFNQAFTTWATSDVIGIAVDIGANTVQVYRNGSTLGTAVTLPSGDLWFYVSSYSGGNVINANFGQRPFSYTPPSGFKALNTYNLPAPSIANGAQYMAATVFSASGSSQVVTNTVNNTSFQTDFLWLKNRTSAGNHYLADLIRGPSNLLYSDATSAEGSAPSFITSFNSNGFTINTNGVYTNGNSIVGWQWKGGGTGVTNTSGSITSTVSANPSAGFSIATYSGNGTNGATVGHGLGVKPDMIIIKGRNASTGSSQWICQHVSLSGGVTANSSTFTLSGYTQAIYLNLTNAAASYAFDAQVNGASGTYVAYCFSAIRGYSAFGSYTGNGSADGPFIYTGFRPRFIMIKNATAINNWAIIDTSRDAYNGALTRLHPNLTNADNTGAGIVLDVLSNGFKCRNSDPLENQSGQTIIYAAFAEHPFNYSRAR